MQSYFSFAKKKHSNENHLSQKILQIAVENKFLVKIICCLARIKGLQANRFIFCACYLALNRSFVMELWRKIIYEFIMTANLFMAFRLSLALFDFCLFAWERDVIVVALHPLLSIVCQVTLRSFSKYLKL